MSEFGSGWYKMKIYKISREMLSVELIIPKHLLKYFEYDSHLIFRENIFKPKTLLLFVYGYYNTYNNKEIDTIMEFLECVKKENGDIFVYFEKEFLNKFIPKAMVLDANEFMKKEYSDYWIKIRYEKTRYDINQVFVKLPKIFYSRFMRSKSLNYIGVKIINSKLGSEFLYCKFYQNIEGRFSVFDYKYNEEELKLYKKRKNPEWKTEVKNITNLPSDIIDIIIDDFLEIDNDEIYLQERPRLFKSTYKTITFYD
jgi:hypothetical protein